MIALLCIDTETRRVRRYLAPFMGKAPNPVDTVWIRRPQRPDLEQQLESLRRGTMDTSNLSPS